jgi:hypothetical protein
MEAGEVHAERREAPAPQDALFPISNVRVSSDAGGVKLEALVICCAWLSALGMLAAMVGALAGTYVGRFTS